MGIGIDIQHIIKRYPSATRNSLEGVSLTINPGSKFGILGPNGAGKTTLISIICGIIEKTEGNIFYHSDKGEIEYKEFRKKLGFVPQDYALFQELTPKQNLEYFGALYNLNRKQIASQTDYLLNKLGLAAVSDKQVCTFSGGMKRRVNLAIGIIHQPQILIHDFLQPKGLVHLHFSFPQVRHRSPTVSDDGSADGILVCHRVHRNGIPETAGRPRTKKSFSVAQHAHIRHLYDACVSRRRLSRLCRSQKIYHGFSLPFRRYGVF